MSSVCKKNKNFRLQCTGLTLIVMKNVTDATFTFVSASPTPTVTASTSGPRGLIPASADEISDILAPLYISWRLVRQRQKTKGVCKQNPGRFRSSCDTH